jgi:ATP-dependent DNA helicase DinG
LSTASISAQPLPSLHDFFSPGGMLSRSSLPYEFRRGQLEMARAVERSLQQGKHLIVEAGTGTGKTFAYLVPALLSGRSVIISTGTRTLQDQLFRRDVPLLAKALGMPVKVALLKGRGNYLCRHRLELAASQGSLFDGERGAQRTLARISRWAGTTKTGTVWDRSAHSTRAATSSMRGATPRQPTSSS